MDFFEGRVQSRVKADLIISNVGQLVTMSGHSNSPCKMPDEASLGLVGKTGANRTCIASKNGIILYVGEKSELYQTISSSAANEINAKGKLVIPGFVDSHTHSIFAGSREKELSDKLTGLSYLDILAKGGGILNTMRETRSASDRQIQNETRSRLDRLVTLGTTSVEIKSGYGLELQNEIRLLRNLKQLKQSLKIDITPTLLSAHAIPPEFKNENLRYIENIVKPSIDIAAREGIAKFCDVFMEKGVFGAQESLDILSYARTKGLKLKIHADEFSDLGGASLAAKLHVTSADHLMRASTRGIKSLSKAGVISVLLPSTTLSSFSTRYANAREIIRLGVAVALATDLSPGSWVESMQLVISLACYGMRMTAAEALVASTINGAHSIDRAGQVGSIEVGKQCDVLLMDLSNYQELPYRIGTNNVATVVKRGRVVHSIYN